MVSIVVPDDVGLSSENGGQWFNHSIVVRSIVGCDTMQFATYIVLAERIIYDSGNVLTSVLAVNLLKSNKPLVKMEPSIDIMPCDGYKNLLAFSKICHRKNAIIRVIVISSRDIRNIPKNAILLLDVHASNATLTFKSLLVNSSFNATLSSLAALFKALATDRRFGTVQSG